MAARMGIGIAMSQRDHRHFFADCSDCKAETEHIAYRQAVAGATLDIEECSVCWRRVTVKRGVDRSIIRITVQSMKELPE